MCVHLSVSLSTLFWEANIQINKFIVSWQIKSNHIEIVLQTLKNSDIVNKNGIETMIEDWKIPNGPNLTLLIIVGIKDPCWPEVRDVVKHCQGDGIKVWTMTRIPRNRTSNFHISQCVWSFRMGILLLNEENFVTIPTRKQINICKASLSWGGRFHQISCKCHDVEGNEQGCFRDNIRY